MKRVERAARQHRQDRAALEFLRTVPDLFIRDEMANGWRPRPPRGATPTTVFLDEAERGVMSSDAARTMAGFDLNEMYVRPEPDPAPALSPDLWDKLFGGKIIDLDGAPVEIIQFPCPECGGSGNINSWDGGDYWECDACGGNGSAEAPLFNMEPPKTTGETND